MVKEARHLQNFIACGALGHPHLEAALQDVLHVHRVVAREGLVLARKHLSVETLHGRCAEGWLLRDHLIKDTTGGPDIAAVIVGHVFPDFRTGIVWSSCLCAHHPALGDSGDVHVAEFDNTLASHEDVCAFNVPVADAKIVEGLESADNLDEKVPDLSLREDRVFLLVVVDHLQKVTTVSVLHDYAETHVLKEGLFVTDNVRVVDRGKDSHLIKSVFLLFAGQFAHFDLLHGVDGAIRFSLDFVHFTEAAFTCVNGKRLS